MKGEIATVRALLEGGRCTLSIAGEYSGMPGGECSLRHVDSGGGDGHVPGTVPGDASRGTFWQRCWEQQRVRGLRVRWDAGALPELPQPWCSDFYISHLINPGSRWCLFTAYDYYLCFSSNIVSALKGNEHKGKYCTFSLLKFH